MSGQPQRFDPVGTGETDREHQPAAGDAEADRPCQSPGSQASLKIGFNPVHRFDLAVAAVMAHSRAVELARRPKPSIYVG